MFKIATVSDNMIIRDRKKKVNKNECLFGICLAFISAI